MRPLILLLCALATWAADPTTRIYSQGDLTITIALPDRVAGHYRGTRFDHGGIVTSAVWRGHSFLGLLKPPHKPAAHDGASGTPEEFHIGGPPGFATAQPGEAFLKIGVGTLLKPDAKSYHFGRAYQVEQWAEWEVQEHDDGVTCTHAVSAGALGARASRRIRLLPEGDGFVIERSITSTGTAPLPVEHYNHTMVVIDGDPIGPAYTLTYPAATAVGVKHANLVAEGPVVRFLEPWKGGLWTQIDGLPDSIAAASVRIEHIGKGLTLELSGDTAPSKVVVYAETTAICPEVFTAFTLERGQTRRWSQTYRFSATARP